MLCTSTQRSSVEQPGNHSWTMAPTDGLTIHVEAMLKSATTEAATLAMKKTMHRSTMESVELHKCSSLVPGTMGDYVVGKLNMFGTRKVLHLQHSFRA